MSEPGDVDLKPDSRLQIVVDTREQAGKGWTFDPARVSVARKVLPAGDYSVQGLEDRVAIERKTLGDCVNTVIGNWLRFRKELNRLSGYDVALIVVEAEWSQLVNHEYESEAEPTAVMGRLNSITIDHGIPVAFWGTRRMAADNAHRFLLLAWRKLANGEL